MIAADHLAFLLGTPLGEVCRNGKMLADGFLRAQRMYHSDFIIIFADVSVEAEALGVTLEYFADQNPQPVKPLEIHQLEVVDPSSRGRLPELFEAARICRKEMGDQFTLFFSLKDPFSLAALTLGAENFLGKLITDNAFAEEALEICFASQKKLIRAVLAERYIPFIGAPIASGGLIGEENFRRFALPRLKALLDEAESGGSFRCLHLCGEIGMLTDCLADLRLHLLSFEDWHRRMWDRMSETVPMGFVPTDLFLSGDVGSVRAVTQNCLRVMSKPCVLSTGCDLPARAKPDLVIAMMEA
jgi:uroporphyrinogen-III decarboxylase